jgi:hypothetical protein
LALGASPTLIIFAVNGQQFSITPTGNTYSIALPNLATYAIGINWRGVLGNSGTCFPSQDTLSLQIAAGVTSEGGINWSC